MMAVSLYSTVEVHGRFGETFYLRLQDREVSQVSRVSQLTLIDSCLFGLLFDPEDGTVHSFETSADFYQTTLHHTPEDSSTPP
jgi:hypothetical protein